MAQNVPRVRRLVIKAIGIDIILMIIMNITTMIIMHDRRHHLDKRSST